jgi:hypothetical protein
MIFIRHAEPDSSGNLTARGEKRASEFIRPEGGFIITDQHDPSGKVWLIYSSELPRSVKTANIIFPDVKIRNISELNEWDKSKETMDQFKCRVRRALKWLPEEAIVVSHSRWMTWAHWLLKGEVALGFDYLESFEA